ncbi:MAG: class I SAM-dependent methyltransferase [Deltaproteobacteria bacterium]
MDYAKFTALTPRLYDYLLSHSAAPDPVLAGLIEETQASFGNLSVMQISPDQGAFMQMLTSISKATSVVEVGTFTGYSALCMARGLAPGGRLLACDLSEEFTSVARKYWAMAGVDGRIDLRLGPALDTLRGLGAEHRFDLAFIDADKTGYAAYYEEILARMDGGGIILFDNVLWMGQVIDEANQGEDTLAIRALNDALVADSRVDVVMLAVGDGLTMAVKKQATGQG